MSEYNSIRHFTEVKMRRSKADDYFTKDIIGEFYRNFPDFEEDEEEVREEIDEITDEITEGGPSKFQDKPEGEEDGIKEALGRFYFVSVLWKRTHEENSRVYHDLPDVYREWF